MRETIIHSWHITIRQMRNLMRQPWYVVITLVQPIIWLLLFGGLFKSIASVPGFHAKSYIDFLTPGIVIMSALFSNGWSGMGVIDDMDRGVMDRFLVTPVSRGAIITGRLAQQGVVTIVQSVIIIFLAWLVGAHFPGGIIGVLVLILSAMILGGSISSLSIALALLLRKEESVIAASNLILLPLTFLSSAFMQENLIPHWIRIAAGFNPVDWAVNTGRQAITASVNPAYVSLHGLLLVLFVIICGWLATRAFRSYQRSV
ncbi:MAG TPA: ABC transporter permease [Balneolales bacterium]|nr:ABC transporter permease [Balneolales bacterium]